MEQLNDAEFEAKVLKASGLVVVDFYADWCAPCRAMAPVLEKVAEENKDATFYKLNVDENPVSAQSQGIRGIPAFLFFNDGKLVDTLIGAGPKSRFEAILAKYLVR